MNKMIALVAALALPMAICAQDTTKAAPKAKPAVSAMKKAPSDSAKAMKHAGKKHASKKAAAAK